MKASLQGNTTYSQQRAKVLSQQSDRVGKLFQVNNFYENNHINVKKLKQRIIEAKRKLLSQKTQQIKQQIAQRSSYTRNKQLSINHQRTRRNNSRVTEHHTRKHDRKVKRLVTDLGEYDAPRKLTQTKSRMAFGQDTPSAKDSRSLFSVNLEPKKKLLSRREQVNEFQMKVNVLWDLYEVIIEIMQGFDISKKVNQKLIQFYIKQVSSQKFQFIHELCQIIFQRRSQRTIRMTRVFENLSIFEACLYSIEKKKDKASQIINCLGYSSSSIIFLIKLIFTTHETAYTLSEKTLQILNSINQFQHESYKTELRQPKDILRRMEHNNEIIAMLKVRCGRKHGKYCEQFISQIIKNAQSNPFLPFNDISANIFQFLSFHLHNQGTAGRLPILAMPPFPFLSLKFPKTIVIEPWGVLVYRKNQKLVIRAHTGKFLTQISDSCNLIFWTQLMPKDADVLTNFLPVKDNIYWLYRYHCTASLEYSHKPSMSNKLKNSPYKKNNSRLKTNMSLHNINSSTRFIKDLSKIGCIVENTILIDYDRNNILQQQAQNSILMPWKGEKKDVKLLKLSEEIKNMRKQCEISTKYWVQEVEKVKAQIQPLQRKKIKRDRMSLPKSSLT